MPNDQFDLRFYNLVQAKKFDEARSNLKKRMESGAIDEATTARQLAYILHTEEKPQEAIATVTAAIRRGQDKNRTCQLYRGDIYLEQGEARAAEQDYIAVLDDGGLIAQRFHSYAAFRIAWLRALRGDPSFKSYLDRFPKETDGFILDRIVTRADVNAVFASRRNNR